MSTRSVQTVDESEAAKGKLWYKRWWIWVLAILIVGFLAQGSDDDSSGDAISPSDVQKVAQETEEPDPEASEEVVEADPEPDVQEANEEEVIAVIAGYLQERADSGVMIAQAIQDVSMADRVLTVTFDFASTEADADILRELNPFDNLAEFAGLELSWTTEESQYLRSAVDRVDTFEVSGESLGSRTVAELYEMNTGESYEPGL